MLYNNQFRNESYVGIFWYDINNKDLFGVVSSRASELNSYYSQLFKCNVKTCSTLHYQIWKKNHFRAKDSRFLNADYTLCPRGRVFQLNNNKFVVCVGSWIDKYPEAKSIIIEEFELPIENTEFIKDIHWEIGHGWSEELI